MFEEFRSVPFYVCEEIDVPILFGPEFLQVCPCAVDLSRNRLVLTPSESVRSISASVFSVGRVISQQDLSALPGQKLIFPGFVPNVAF